jgi:serine/threonine protein kinase
VEMPLCALANPRTESALKDLVADVLHGLDALHARGVVHRDVRLPNILQIPNESQVTIFLRDPEQVLVGCLAVILVGIDRPHCRTARRCHKCV